MLRAVACASIILVDRINRLRGANNDPPATVRRALQRSPRRAFQRTLHQDFPAGAAGAGAAAFSLFVVCPLNVRVGANSPSLWPTMFSVTYTGMNFFPLCTAIVCPTISGTTVDRRDQVLMTFFSFVRFIPSTFSSRGVSTNGPFFSERLISDPDGSGLRAPGLKPPEVQSLKPEAYFVLRWTMNRFVLFRWRVLKPLVGCPHGVTGCRPPEVLPSPPPSGWSTGFIATPRTCGRWPSHRLRPALPIETFSCSMLPTWPIVA